MDLSDQLQSSQTVTQADADRNRSRYRTITSQILRWLIARQEFERSSQFRRNTVLADLRRQQKSASYVFSQNQHACGLDELTGAYVGPIKRPEAAACTLSAVHRRSADPRKRRRVTPHPRAGTEAVAAAGGTVEALLAEADSEGEESDCPQGARYSSTEEEESDSTDSD